MSHTNTALAYGLSHHGRALFLAGAVALLAACGGGSGSTAAVASNGGDLVVAALPEATAPSATLSGSIVKGPVSGSQVCAYELVSSGKGKQLGCTVTNADGSYSLTLAFEGEVVVEALGGSYTDEATGLTGVPLSAPLTSVTKLGHGPNVLHATPLTALAYARALATGSLNLAEFQAKANTVRDAFGLAADVDLVRTLPTVGTGSTNPYGAALHGVSKMLGMGATLAGVVASADLGLFKKNYQVAQSVFPAGRVDFLGGKLQGRAVKFIVKQPDPSWRARVLFVDTPMGCNVADYTDDTLTLACPRSALLGNKKLLSGRAAFRAPFETALPSDGLFIIGNHIAVEGDLFEAESSGLSANIVQKVNGVEGLTLTSENKLLVQVQAVSDTKTYEGTTASNKTPIVGSLFGADTVATAPKQVYSSKNVAVAKTLIASGLLINDGNGGNDYAIVYVDSTDAIIKQAVFPFPTGIGDKIYDGSVASPESVGVLQVGGGAGLLAGGNVSHSNVSIGGSIISTDGGAKTGSGAGSLVLNADTQLIGSNYGNVIPFLSTGTITKATVSPLPAAP